MRKRSDMNSPVSTPEPSPDEIQLLSKTLEDQANRFGYHLNPDNNFTKELVRGLLINERRYGYQSCPCRLAAGQKEQDLDIICPCDYRDPDLDDLGTCYCALYVSKKVLEGQKKLQSIPDRRLLMKEEAAKSAAPLKTSLPYPVWRCRVCGYLCARAEPPEVCPICKAEKERFEKFME